MTIATIRSTLDPQTHMIPFPVPFLFFSTLFYLTWSDVFQSLNDDVCPVFLCILIFHYITPSLWCISWKSLFVLRKAGDCGRQCRLMENRCAEYDLWEPVRARGIRRSRESDKNGYRFRNIRLNEVRTSRSRLAKCEWLRQVWSVLLSAQYTKSKRREESSIRLTWVISSSYFISTSHISGFVPSFPFTPSSRYSLIISLKSPTLSLLTWTCLSGRLLKYSRREKTTSIDAMANVPTPIMREIRVDFGRV